MSLKIIFWITVNKISFKKHVKKHAKKGQSKGYKFLNVPDHAYSEIVEVNGVEFKSNPLNLEETKEKHKGRTPDNRNSAHHQFTNYYLNITHQHEQQQEHQHHQQQRYVQQEIP